MANIANYDVESNFTAYKVALYPEKAEVWVVKRGRDGAPYMQAIKRGSGVFRRVLRDLAKRAEPGSLAWENLQACHDTCS